MDSHKHLKDLRVALETATKRRIEGTWSGDNFRSALTDFRDALNAATLVDTQEQQEDFLSALDTLVKKSGGLRGKRSNGEN